MGLLSVLGLADATQEDASSKEHPNAREMASVWNLAKMAVGEKLAALQSACAQFDESSLQAVANAELLADLDDQMQELEWAIMTGTDLDEEIDAMRVAIKADAEIKALDANPMGVATVIAKTLLNALDELASLASPS